MSNDINTINSIEEAEALIAEEVEKQQTAFAEIGRLYYAAHAADCEEVFKPFVEELNASNAAIDECNRRIEAIKNKPTCPECGSPVKPTSLFCTVCGTKLKKAEPEPAPAPDVLICPGCGSEMKPHMRFCTVCGTPLDSKGAPVPPNPPIISAPDLPPVPPTIKYERPDVPEVVVPVDLPLPDAEPKTDPKPEVQPEPKTDSLPAPKRTSYVTPEPDVICTNCGKVTPAGTSFCIHCGTNLLDPSAPAPGADYAAPATSAPVYSYAPTPSSTQAPAASQPQNYGVRRCQFCGHIAADPSMAFCTECGSRLS